ncbi:MAG TPA: 2-iminoacetate synthase ThiH [Candidatus Sulfotelmatobacter sp.]|nr:2-iminoacetate synthase ThiH [Candidatus Sulfotelmatobacter sp.]
MNFAAELAALPLAGLHQRALAAGVGSVRESLGKSRLSLTDFAHLISPAGAELLEPMCRQSQVLTRQRFGKVIRLFAPIYLSNNCVNNCKYCGFARRNDIVRVTLTQEEAQQEARALLAQGFRNLLLVASEHPQLVPPAYLADCVRSLVAHAPSVSLEVAPMAVEDYRLIVQAGADGLVVFQETYDSRLYPELHPSGPKSHFEWRLGTPERAYAAGFRKLGLGALLGLHDWRREALCLAAHASWLLKHCWKAQISISLPRLRPAASGFIPPAPMSDRELVQLVAAYRLMFPDVALVLSTRESDKLRDGLIPLGITHISAGSHTEPGGYTGAGRSRCERQPADGQQATEAVASLTPTASEIASPATGQFNIADERSPSQMAQRLRLLGLEPVWKDWDAALIS